MSSWATASLGMRVPEIRPGAGRLPTGGNGEKYNMMGGGGFGFGHGGFGLLFWLIVLVAVVWAVRGTRRGASGRRRGDDAEKSAIDILEERYARGEIDKDEFERRQRDPEQ